MNPLPSVAIVILNWNGRKFLEKFLPSVMASIYPNKKIIIADNGSTDDSVAFLNQSYPTIEILQNSSNEGFAGGYNTALKQVSADYYVLLNSDVEVTENWIGHVIELMESNERIAACQPKILSYYSKEKFEYAGASGGWIDKYGYPFNRGRIFDECEEDNGQYNDAQPCFWASGAAMFVKAKIYHELKGLDEYFFAHQEEIDFCWRLQLAGYLVYVQPASVVYHVGGGTLPKGNSRNSSVWKIPFRFFLDAVSAWRGLFSGDKGYFLAILRAHLHYFKWLFFHKSKTIFPEIKTLHVNGWFKGSVAWAHFIRKKKTFKEIVGNK